MNREQLIKELLDKNIIKIGESVNYERFQQIHSEYSHISEYHFAEILGINNGNFNNVKNKGQSAIILKDLIPMQEEKLAKEIAEDILSILEAGQRINYDQFCKLRQHYCDIYGDISEARFGRFLELNDDALYRLRKGNLVSILKSKFDPELIVEALIEEGIVVPGDKINYNKFLQIYELAIQNHPSLGHFSQYAFAKLLGIRKSTFSKFKVDPVNLVILKDYMQKNKNKYSITDEERRRIVETLMNDKGAKPYEFCDYERFQELYQGYENISEYNFAHILDMSSSSFYKIKNRGEKARILKDCLDKEQVIAELIASGRLHIGEKIDYSKFSELSREYEYLGVFLFADIIEVSEGNIERLRSNPSSTTIALKSKIKQDKEQENLHDNIKEQAKAYVEELFTTGKIHIGKELDYKSFQEIYSPCNYISEHEFATLLGISYFNYQNIKYMHSKTYIQDCHVIEAVKLIGNIEQGRFYSIDEINSICEQYQITQEDFIRYFVYKGNPKADIQLYMDSLNAHARLYIGRTQMSNEYFEKIQDTFILPIYRLVGSMCKKYRQLRNLEDYKSEAILYILEKCGDIERNLYDCEDKEIIVRMLISRTRFFLLDKIISDLKIAKTQRSTITFYTRRDNKEYIIPDNKSTEEKALASVIDDTTESKIMCELITGFENGMNKLELLESVQVQFGISKKELLELLSKRLELKKKNREMKEMSIE